MPIFLWDYTVKRKIDKWERVGAFEVYAEEEEVEVVGYSNCGGCPGDNIEYVPEEIMKSND